MKQKLLFTFLILFLSSIARAQVAGGLEQQADEWAKKSYQQRKAFSAYLSCFRSYTDKASQLRIIDKVTGIIATKKFIFNSETSVIDSLIDAASTALPGEYKHILPLLEGRIIKSSNTINKFQHEFELYDKVLAIRSAHHLTSGKDYEQLLRWHVSKLIYRKDISNEQQQKEYAHLWEVYRQNNPGTDSLDLKLLDSYDLKCRINHDYLTSISLQNEKLQYLGNKEGKDSPSYKETSRDIASSYSLLIYNLLGEKKDTTEARRLANVHAEQVKTNNGKETKEYCEAMDLVLTTYDSSDASTIPILQELLPIAEKVYGKSDDFYKAIQSRLTLLLSQTHRKQEAIDIQTKGTSMDDMTELSSLATKHDSYGNYREAISLYEKMLEYYASHPEENKYNIITPVYSITNNYVKLNDAQGLLTFGKKWCNDKRLQADVKEFIFKTVSNNAAMPGFSSQATLQFIDNYVKSHPSATATAVGKAEVSGLRAMAYIGMLNFGKAEETLANTISDLKKNIADISHIVKYEQYLEICYAFQAKWDSAKAQNEHTMSMIKQLPDYTKMREYRSLCCMMIYYQNKLNNFDEVLRLFDIVDKFNDQTAISLVPNDYDINEFSVITTLMGPSNVETERYIALCHKGKAAQAATLLNLDFKSKTDLLKFTLESQNKESDQSNTIWTQQVNDNIANVAMYDNISDMAIMLYNYELLYKQAYLSSGNLMRQQILNSGDSSVIEKFNELQNLRTTIQQQETAGKTDSKVNERYKQLEDQLIEDSKVYGDFTRGLDKKWTDIQNALEPKDIAIEFVSYQSYEDNEKHIAALLLRQGWQSPKYIQLFPVSKIAKDPYNDRAFAKLCWEPIAQYLNGIKNIYFSPAGELYNIGIESLMLPDGTGRMAEKYDIYRISSTRELAMHSSSQTEKGETAVIYGGLDYSASTEDIAEQDKQYNNKGTEESNNTEALRELRGAMGSAPYLEGTKTEAQDIVATLQSSQNSIHTTLYTGSKGTEASFKALSGKGVNIMHISTHGFYNQATPTTNLLLNNKQNREDMALSRSGLLFAGADNALSGEATSTDDDGVLTALEISTLDLRHLDLVVLSACQTAQGDISGDGVFGLQRGFKKAGANSILMSLWKVDDEATCFLMTQFYKNWMSGKSKHQALELAKQAVRTQTGKGWDNPKYWAAFILLDAIDK